MIRINYKDSLDYSKLIEVKQLNQKQINNLTNIVYNTDYKVHYYLEPAFYADGGGGCFDPRNAFIFLDKNGKVFDYIEICFECFNSASKSEKITIGTNCNQKFNLLKKYFINLGIKYGTITK